MNKLSINDKIKTVIVLTKLDFIIIFAIIVVSVTAIFTLPKIEASGIEVKVDGEVIYRKDFQSKPIKKLFQTKYGINLIEIGPDYVVMLESNCPRQLAVRQGKIKSSGSSLICIPHHMTVTIVGDDEDKIDMMVK
ncbi:hypothetical protein HMPREF1634_04210 [Tissierellia bacterium S7-1-4]|nr:hypothetical protein HMPREF1634_04210 [Tissierellia bacterium S7-1-4]